MSVKKKQPEDILAFIHDGDDLILPIANGEPQCINGYNGRKRQRNFRMFEFIKCMR